MVCDQREMMSVVWITYIYSVQLGAHYLPSRIFFSRSADMKRVNMSTTR